MIDSGDLRTMIVFRPSPLQAPFIVNMSDLIKQEQREQLEQAQEEAATWKAAWARLEKKHKKLKREKEELMRENEVLYREKGALFDQVNAIREILGMEYENDEA
ncbi:hypothetical protein K525DRAFT_275157 [Schizophyllum commune Loenen D]|nr:hypothetical protein K525DRAFT_275157 [Schizophyllum commune Loenen D]